MHTGRQNNNISSQRRWAKRLPFDDTTKGWMSHLGLRILSRNFDPKQKEGISQLGTSLSSTDIVGRGLSIPLILRAGFLHRHDVNGSTMYSGVNF